MKLLKQTVFFSVIFILSFSIHSCGKYPDGPGISLRSKLLRITGDWDIVSVNDSFDEDILNTITVSGNTTTTSQKVISVEIDRDKKFVFKISEKITTDYYSSGVLEITDIETRSYVDKGIWSFSKDKESVNFSHEFSDSYIYAMIGGNTFAPNFDVNISRLTNDEFNFVDDFGNVWELEKK